MSVTNTPAPPAPPAPPVPPAPVAGQTADQIALANEVKAAEKRLADARTAAAAAATPKVTSFVGLPNGPFVIEGENLGAVNPQHGVQINGITAKITAVRSHNIKGTTPLDVAPGKKVRVQVQGAALYTEGFVG